jgi:hypothetical protein
MLMAGEISFDTYVKYVGQIFDFSNVIKSKSSKSQESSVSESSDSDSEYSSELSNYLIFEIYL